MATAKVCRSRPEKRATRPTGMGRASTISLVGDNDDFNPNDLRAQRLRRNYRMSPSLTAFFAALIWEVRS